MAPASFDPFLDDGTGPAQTGPPPVPTRRVFAFLLLLGALTLWLNHHLGWGPTSLGPLAGAVAALTVAWRALGWLASSSQEQVGTGLRKLLAPVLSAAFLKVCGAAFALAVLSVSSVTLALEGGARGVPSVVPTDGGTALAAPTVAGFQRFVVLTSPFGRSVRVRVAGFLPEVVTVYPVLSRTLRPDTDLRPAPSALIRPSLAALPKLQNHGRLIVYQKAEGLAAPTPPLATLSGVRASLLLGIAQPVPAAFVQTWQLELLSQRLDEGLRAQALLDWSRLEHVRPAVELEPGMTLVAEVRSRADKVVAAREFTLGSEHLIDVVLLDAVAE